MESTISFLNSRKKLGIHFSRRGLPTARLESLTSPWERSTLTTMPLRCPQFLYSSFNSNFTSRNIKFYAHIKSLTILLCLNTNNQLSLHWLCSIHFHLRQLKGTSPPRPPGGGYHHYSRGRNEGGPCCGEVPPFLSLAVK